MKWLHHALVVMVVLQHCLCKDLNPVLPAGLNVVNSITDPFFSYIGKLSLVNSTHAAYFVREGDMNSNYWSGLMVAPAIPAANSTSFNLTQSILMQYPEAVVGEAYSVSHNGTTFLLGFASNSSTDSFLLLAIANNDGQALVQPQTWIDPAIAEPIFCAQNGSSCGEYVPAANTSSVLVDYNHYEVLVNDGSQGQDVGTYLLVRTELVGSVKILKYSNAPFTPASFQWKTVLVPKIIDTQGGPVPLGVGHLQRLPQSSTLPDSIVVLLNVEQEDVLATQNYLQQNLRLNVTLAKGIDVNLMFVIDSSNGNVISLTQLNNADFMWNRVASMFLAIPPNPTSENVYAYVATRGRLNNGTLASYIFKTKLVPGIDSNNTAGAYLTIYSNGINQACSPPAQSVTAEVVRVIQVGMGDREVLVIGGAAGYNQVTTGSVVAPGMAFLAFADPIQFFNSSMTSSTVSIKYFGTPSRDNSVADALEFQQGQLLFSAIFDKGLTHDDRQMQYDWSAILVETNVTAKCVFELTCQNNTCTSWCLEPHNPQTDSQSYAECVSEGDSGDGNKKLVIILLSCAAGVVVVLMGIAFVVIRRRRSAYKPI